jgi:hypothetical protein
MLAATSARSFALARLGRSLLVPLAIALPPLPWVIEATRRATFTTLGRDQGIFQYIAWALQQGAADFRDVRDVNGPLAHLVHFVFLTLGGADEHRFRTLDLAVTGTTFALVGACVPGLRQKRPPEWLDRIAWAIAGWVVLSGQYLLYRYWDSAQRESFFDWFMLPSLGLQLVAQAGWTPPGRQARLFALVGALSIVPWFGKPTYALFTLLQVTVIACDDRLRVSRRRAALAFSLGAALGAATQLGFVAFYGDAGAYMRIQLLDVPTMYRFIWPRSPADIFSEPWRATQAIFSLVGAVVLLTLIYMGEMPRRVLGIALAPLCAIAGVIVQAKGFPYHFHPVTATVHLQWLIFAAWIGERARFAQRRLAAARLVPVGVGAVLALRVATAMEDSPYVRAVWLLWANTPEWRATPEYFAHFQEPDFFPFELRQAADYVRRHTGPSERVQSYGMDPYLLFLAKRQSATPYIYAYDLNVDAALVGGTGGRPNESQQARIRSKRDASEADMLARLEAKPPAAFVFIDGSPLLSDTEAWSDFVEHCSRTANWVRDRYRETATFGHNHIWLRIDIPNGASEPTEHEPDD